MQILFHGRFQPPHIGHIKIIEYFLKKYPKSRMIVSLDVRNKDLSNPFSFNFRKKILLDNLNKYKNRVIITCHKCIKPTFLGCLLPTYKNAKKFGEIGLVVGGLETPNQVKRFWGSRGIKVETSNKKFFNISATEIRAVHNAKKLGFSLITNFGCKYNHWYCVWLNFHKLKKCKTNFRNTNWKKLDELIKWYQGNKINISGGLDPLYNYKKNKKWWKKLFEVLNKNKKLVDVHTREFVFEKSFLSNINKLVISFDNLAEIKNKVLKFPKSTRIRLAKIITKGTSLHELKNIVDFCKENNLEITFKELYGFDDSGKFSKLKKQLKKVYNFKRNKIKFLEHKDYNIYFMPDNKIYTNFLLSPPMNSAGL